MGFKVSATPAYLSQAERLTRKYPSFKTELEQFYELLSTNPVQGQGIGHGLYKIRLAVKSKGKGKSVGTRVITFVAFTEQEVTLLAVYDKSEVETITDKELVQILRRFILSRE